MIAGRPGTSQDVHLDLLLMNLGEEGLGLGILGWREVDMFLLSSVEEAAGAQDF